MKLPHAIQRYWLNKELDFSPRYARALDLADVKPHDFRRFVGIQLVKKDIRLAQKQLGHK